MSAAFVVLFPSWAIILHLISYPKIVPRFHGPLQVATLALSIAGAGLGIYLGVKSSIMGEYHPIIGLVLMGGLLLFQPAMGVTQHLHYRNSGAHGRAARFLRNHQVFNFLFLEGMMVAGATDLSAGPLEPLITAYG